MRVEVRRPTREDGHENPHGLVARSGDTDLPLPVRSDTDYAVQGDHSDTAPDFDTSAMSASALAMFCRTSARRSAM